LKKRLFLLTLAIVLLVVGINIAVRGEYISGKIRDRVVELARKELGLDVGMEGLVFNVFPSYIDLEGPYVAGWDPDFPDRRIRARSARIYISLPALLNRDLYISRVQISEPNALLERRLDGTYNFGYIIEKLKKAGAPGKPASAGEPEGGGSAEELPVEVKEVVLSDVEIAYIDRQAPLAVSLGNGGVDIRFEEGGDTWFSYNLRDVVTARSGSRPFHIAMSGETTLSKDSARFESLKLSAENTAIKVDGTVSMKDDVPELDLGVDARVDLKLLRAVGLLTEGPSGTAAVKGRVKGVYPDLNGGGTLSLKDGSYEGLDVRSITAGFTFDGGRLKVDGIKAALLGGELSGNVTALFEDAGIRHVSGWRFDHLVTGHFTERHPELAIVPWQEVSGSLELAGTGLDTKTFRGSGRLEVNKYEGPHEAPHEWAELAIIKQVALEYAIKDGGFDITKGSARSADCWADFRGRLGFGLGMNFAFTAGSSDIGEIGTIIGYDGIDGRTEAAGTVTGTLLVPTIKGNARITDGYAGGISFPSAHGEVVLKDWILSVHDFVVNQEYGEFGIDGSIRFQGKGADFYHPYFDAVAQVRQARVRPIIAIFYEDIPVDLQADGTIEFHGKTSDYTGSAELTVGDGEVYGQKVDKGSVKAELDTGGISFPEVIAVRERDIVTASGRIGFDGTFEGKASSARVDLENFDLLKSYGVPVKGSASVSVTGGGSFSDPVITANVKPYSLFLKDVDIGGGTVEARIAKGRLSGTASLMEDKVRAEAGMSLGAPYAWDASVEFDSGRFEPFIRMAYPALPEEVSLVCTGKVSASGSMDGGPDERAALEFQDVEATVMGRTMRNQGPVRVTYDGGRVSIGSLAFEGENMHFSVSGGADDPHSLSLDVSAGFDASLIGHFYEEDLDYVDGRVEAAFSLTGDIAEPSISGRLDVAGGAVRFAGHPQRVDDIKAEVLFDGGTFNLKSFSASYGGGTLTGTGRGGFAGWNVDNFTFNVTADDVRVKYPGELNSVLDAELYAEGEGDKRVLGGEITVVKSRYTERVEWKSWLTMFTRKRKEILASEPGPLGDVALNLHIASDETIRVDNNLAKINVGADLTIRGTVARPVLLGRLEATSGQVFLRNNSFKLTNAVVEFADPTTINPIIDLQAETQVREYQIRMMLSGTMDKLDMTFSSDPPLEDRDVLALLTVGRVAEDVAGQEGLISTGEAASFVTGRLQDAVEERVMRLTGFDRFQIDPYTTSSGSSTGPRLTVGKRLFSDRLYITYSSNLGTSEDQFVRLEYIVNRNMSLVGERDELGRIGGDLKLRFEFR